MTYKLVAVGASWGGMRALQDLLTSLPPEFPAAIAVAQHRDKQSDDALSAALQRCSALPLGEAEDKQPIVGGRVYLAPADYHLLVEPGSFALSTEAPINFARPSIDALFESAAAAYREQLIGVILTGANHDGAAGLAAVKACHGHTLVQDPATAEKSMMPQAAIAATRVDEMLPLADIGRRLVQLCCALTLPSPPGGEGGGEEEHGERARPWKSRSKQPTT